MKLLVSIVKEHVVLEMHYKLTDYI
jgi:hypothetical protein